MVIVKATYTYKWPINAGKKNEGSGGEDTVKSVSREVINLKNMNPNTCDTGSVPSG